MNAETVSYEQAAGDCDAAAPVLMTCIVFNEERVQLIEESHVFLPACRRYIQSTRYRKLTDTARRHSLEDGIHATRALFLRQMASPGTADSGANVLCGFERLATSPFHGFKLAKQFLHEMAEIQEWTASAGLRRLLAEVLSYKSDREESDLIARIFNDYTASRSEALAAARGYALNPLASFRWQARPETGNDR